MDEKLMTVFYSKRNGDIRLVLKGVKDFSVYGELGVDMSSAIGCTVAEENQYILDNPHLFRISLSDMTIQDITELDDKTRMAQLELQLSAVKQENESLMEVIDTVLMEIR